MPNVTVSSLKKENDSLKDEIGALKRNLEELQQSIKRQDPKASSNGGEQPTRAITEAESLNTLEFYGKSYDDLRAESANSLKQLWSRLKPLELKFQIKKPPTVFLPEMPPLALDQLFANSQEDL